MSLLFASISFGFLNALISNENNVYSFNHQFNTILNTDIKIIDTSRGER